MQAHRPVTSAQPHHKCWLRFVARRSRGYGCAASLSETEDGEPVFRGKANTGLRNESIQRCMFQGLLLGLVEALKQGFSHVQILGVNEVLHKQVCPARLVQAEAHAASTAGSIVMHHLRGDSLSREMLLCS